MQSYITLKINKCISYKEKERFTVRVCIITIVIIIMLQLFEVSVYESSNRLLFFFIGFRSAGGFG